MDEDLKEKSLILQAEMVAAYRDRGHEGYTDWEMDRHLHSKGRYFVHSSLMPARCKLEEQGLVAKRNACVCSDGKFDPITTGYGRIWVASEDRLCD